MRAYWKRYVPGDPPNWLKNISTAYPQAGDLNVPERECDYCEDPEPVPNVQLRKLPNGLYICDNHKSGQERKIEGLKRAVTDE